MPEDDQNLETVMGLIMNGGNAKSSAQGDHAKVTLLMVHSQDHLMNAITFRDLAGEIVALYKRLAEKYA